MKRKKLFLNKEKLVKVPVLGVAFIHSKATVEICFY